MRTYKIHMLRHGLTQTNVDGIYCGSADIPLCGEGVSDLQRLIGEYDYPFAEILYTSPLLRARQSANILFPDCLQEPVEGLREASFGVYEGRSFRELQDNPDFQKWVTFGSDFVPQGAEAPDVFAQRCIETFIEITTNLMRNGIFTAAIMTHASVIATVLAALAYPKKSAYDWQCYPGCGYTVLADPTLFGREPVVEVIATVPENLDL